MSIEGQGHFFIIYFQVLYVLCFTWRRYQVSVYRTIGPLVNWILFIFGGNEDMHKSSDVFEIWPDATTGFYGNR